MPGFRLPVTVRVSLAAATAVAATLTGLGASASAQSDIRHPVSYVALGDSYSANVFVRPWEESDGCGRSYHDYPRQVAERFGLELDDVTCGAAEVQDGILGPQPSDKLLGPPTTPPPGGWPQRPPQLDALHLDTDLVSVGIGGNTLGFGDIVTECLARGLTTLGLGKPCTNYYTTGDGRAWLDQHFAQLDYQFTEMMDGIRARAPHARVAVVGYPAIVPDSTGCTWGNFSQLGTVAKGDMPWLDSLERDLNGLLRQQAEEHGATYVDTYGSSIEHGVCRSGDQKWMYGIKDNLTGDGDQTDPPAGICKDIPGAGEACTFVHPNVLGSENQARQVAAAFGALGAIPAGPDQP
ncbi:SGNH/GDSL hydrolase family protein [Streptacidiphilus sp. 4-A2]|nr:SGNH/GDSL hydrolase family protein [Streptacidiphilus sp. 4-A2]